MAISIRLTRGGSKKRPYYRIVVADARSPRDGRFIEKIGTYNPLLAKDSEDRVKLDGDRAKHWLSVGAQPTDRVARFLDAMGIRERTARSNPNKGKPGEKAVERAEEREGKATAAAEAAAEAAAAAAAAPEPEPTPEPEAEAPVAESNEGSDAAAETAAPAAEETTAAAEPAGDAAPVEEAAPASSASNEGESASAPVEGADDAVEEAKA